VAQEKPLWLVAWEKKSVKSSPAFFFKDNYYLDQSQNFDRDGGAVNFDHPRSIDFDLMATHLQQLIAGDAIEIPQYDFATHSRTGKTLRLEPKPIILVDGTLILSQPKLRPLFDESIFLKVSEIIRFRRRFHRDVQERGRQPEGVRNQFLSQVKPMHDRFVEPSKERATYVVSSDHSINRCIESLMAKYLPYLQAQETPQALHDLSNTIDLIFTNSRIPNLESSLP
jgi:uridine kinase